MTAFNYNFLQGYSDMKTPLIWFTNFLLDSINSGFAAPVQIWLVCKAVSLAFQGFKFMCFQKP